MNLQQALVTARTLNYATHSIVHIGKESERKYVIALIMFNEEESWYVLEYISGHIPPTYFGEGDSYCGDDLNELTKDIKRAFTEIPDFNFILYPKPFPTIDMEPAFTLHELLPEIVPDPQQVFNWEPIITEVDSYLAKQS